MVVLLALFFAFNPVLDNLFCAGEGTPGSAHSAILTDGDAGGGQALPDTDAPCTHGHCHQVMGSPTPAQMALTAPPIDPKSPFTALTPPSLPPSSIDRPPRA